MFLLAFVFIAAIAAALMTLQGALVLWVVGLFTHFDWTWLQAFGVGLVLSIVGGLFRVTVTKE